MKALYYSNGMDVFGPVSLEDFSKNKYYKSTLIWHDGLIGWVPIGDFKELKHLIGSWSTPSLDKVIPSKSDEAPPLSKSGYLPVPFIKRKIGLLWTVTLLTVGILLLYFLYKIPEIKENKITFSEINAVKNAMLIDRNFRHAPEQLRIAGEESERKTYRKNWTRFITALPNSFKSNLLTGIRDLKITLNNNSPYLLDSVNVKVLYLKANGDTYQSEVLQFKNVNPNSSEYLYSPDSKRGAKIICTIISVHSKVMKMCFDKKEKRMGEDPYFCQ